MTSRQSVRFRRLTARLGALATLVAGLTLAIASPRADQEAAPAQAYRNLTATVQGVKVTLTYDLVAPTPANEVFNVSLEVRLKGTGQLVTVSRASLSGDGIGRNCTAGPQKTIVWNAGLDVETPQFELYEYALVVTAAPPTGQIAVVSTPPGASVTLDDDVQPRGVTPLTIENVTVGPHVIVIRRSGYLPNRHDAPVAAGATASVSVVLTPEPPPTAGSPQGPASGVAPAAKSGMPKWLLPVAGAGAVAAVVAARKGGGNGACTFSLSPTGYASPPQAGGSVTVAVTVSPAACSPQTWTASSLSSFVHVSPASGSGNQSVTVRVDANTPDQGTASRSGSATIAGIVFPVTNQTNATSMSGNVAASEQDGSATFPAFSGVTIVAGQKLTLTATGTISVAGIGPVGPAGDGSGNAGSAGRLPGAPKYALVCGIGGQTIIDLFYAGPGSTFASGTIATVGGTLYCGMNAPDLTGFTGNSGAWLVTVKIGG